MFKHRGRQRTALHNRKIASLLSFVAGMVNVSGFFAVGHLTTNVTGHFAFFADEIAQNNYSYALVYLAFILSFLCGAFFSSLYTEAISKKYPRYRYSFPVGFEIAILTFIAQLPIAIIDHYPIEIACALLFAMGMQNALVTNISKSVVRTTHLTGLFTDLGIELSQLFFFKESSQQKRLKVSIKLRVIIIISFFIGGLIGGFGFPIFGLKTLLLASLFLLIGLFYDAVKFQLVTFNRRYIRRNRFRK
jgi:uncharacterized membrane protein YoaK (UPF0700 family)